jgi:hypothetical protein
MPKDNAEKRKKAELILQTTALQWPSNYVARTEIKRFTGGALSPGYLANLDSIGTGPAGAFSIGRKIVYPKDQLTDWLISRLEV